jgi:hypothetical protein
MNPCSSFCGGKKKIEHFLNISIKICIKSKIYESKNIFLITFFKIFLMINDKFTTNIVIVDLYNFVKI